MRSTSALRAVGEPERTTSEELFGLLSLFLGPFAAFLAATVLNQ